MSGKQWRAVLLASILSRFLILFLFFFLDASFYDYDTSTAIDSKCHTYEAGHHNLVWDDDGEFTGNRIYAAIL